MPNTLVSTGFTQEAFDSFLAARDEPGWLSDLRRDAWSRFAELGMPSRQDEEWARTDIRLFKLDRFGFPAGTAPEGSELPHALLAEGVALGGSTATLDSAQFTEILSAKWASKGVLFGSLPAMVAEHGELLRPFFERRLVNPAKDTFSALNAAAWAGGALLYVPRRAAIDEPLHSLSALSDGGVDLNKTLVILEEGAEATLLLETASTSPQAGGFHDGSIEIIIEPDARLRLVTLQNWGDQVWHFAHQMAHIARDGHIQWTIGALGSRLAKVNQHVALTGEGAEAQVNGVMFTQGRQHLSYNTHQHHRAAHCRSDLLYKAALQDHSRTVWRGMIKVDRGAQRTDAYQRNDNLMLSREARADSIPGLEIEADDVRCTHGSTSGRVDDQQIFYAMTRGYTRQEAVRMIVEGFFQQVFDRIPIESVSEALGEAIGRRVRAIAEQ
jgi:Fe-S cluster assembly protein SufD